MKSPLRPVSLVLLVVLLGVTIAGFFTTSKVRDDLEQQLLEDRAKEVALILGQAGSQVQTLMGSLTTVIRATGAESEAFVSAAAPYIEAGFGEIAVVVPGPDGYTVANTTGGENEVGDVIDDDVAPLLDEAVDPSAFSSFTFRRGESRVLALALLAGSPDGAVVFTETSLDATAEASADQESAAFSEVKVAMYVSSELTDESFIFSTDDERTFDGQVVEPIPFGATEWAVAVAARDNLAGDLTSALPFLLLVAGVLITLAVCVLVESVQRRREYAERMVRAREAELEETHQLLVEAEKAAAVGEMAATMAHELRNPLGVLTNVHFLLRARLGGDDPVSRTIDQADREVGAATSIVSDILAFTRPRDLITTTVVVSEIIDEVLTTSPPPTGVVVDTSGVESSLVIDADRDLARQSIAALVANAVDAVADRPDGTGTITITTRGAGDRLEVCVADDGVGMMPDVVSRVYEPFFSTRINGVGLGVTVASQIAAAHGGTLDIESSPTTGTKATLRWPTSPAPASAIAQTEEIS